MKFSAIREKIKNIRAPLITAYPVIVILIIPLLLVINTYWNLKSFNRDANFILRHQAIAIADTLTSQLENQTDKNKLQETINNITKVNTDLVSITILKKSADIYEPYVTTLKGESSKSLSDFPLNQMAVGFNEPFAALSYSPELGRNIWSVVVPYSGDASYLLNFQLDSKSVAEILARTSKDSLIVLIILIVFTFVLLANHFYFYLRAIRTKQLEELDRLKDEFISMAAHELRAPITAITGYLEMLKDQIGSGKTESVNEEIGTLTILTRDLNNLVEDLLDVSRIEQGRIKVEMKDTDITEVIGNAVTIMEPLAREKNLKLDFVKNEVPRVKTDPDRLRQIITNLISNSVKYTLKGGVTVKTETDGKNITIAVSDTGIGIPPEEVKKLFGKFHRVKDRKTMDVRGTGLGLWITKKMVELLGGRITVESIYGSGSNFSFTLPLNI